MATVCFIKAELILKEEEVDPCSPSGTCEVVVGGFSTTLEV